MPSCWPPAPHRPRRSHRGARRARGRWLSDASAACRPSRSLLRRLQQCAYRSSREIWARGRGGRRTWLKLDGPIDFGLVDQRHDACRIGVPCGAAHAAVPAAAALPPPHSWACTRRCAHGRSGPRDRAAVRCRTRLSLHRGEQSAAWDHLWIEWHLLGGHLSANVEDGLAVSPGQRIAGTAAVPHDGETSGRLEDSRELDQRFRRLEPVKRLRAESRRQPIRRTGRWLQPCQPPRTRWDEERPHVASPRRARRRAPARHGLPAGAPRCRCRPRRRRSPDYRAGRAPRGSPQSPRRDTTAGT